MATPNYNLAAYYGDPSKFKADFVDNGNQLAVVPAIDYDGSAANFILLVNGPVGTPDAYDYQNLAKRNHSGSASAKEIFEKLEADNYAAQGFTDNGSQIRAKNRLDNDPVSGVMSVYSPASSIEDWGGVDWRVNTGGDAPTLLGPASPGGLSGDRAIIRVKITPNNGNASFTVICEANLRLRICYMIGLEGTVTGGEDWIPELFETLKDIALIVIAVWSGNVGMAIGAIADIAITWYGYVQAQADAAAKLQAEKDAINGKQKLPLAPPPGKGPASTPKKIVQLGRAAQHAPITTLRGMLKKTPAAPPPTPAPPPDSDAPAPPPTPAPKPENIPLTAGDLAREQKLVKWGAIFAIAALAGAVLIHEAG